MCTITVEAIYVIIFVTLIAKVAMLKTFPESAIFH